MSSFSKHCIQLVFNSWLPFKATMAFSTISSCALFKVCEFNSFTRLFSRSMKKLYAWSEMWSSPLSQDCFPFVTCRVSRNIEFSPVLNMVRWRSLKLASDLVSTLARVKLLFVKTFLWIYFLAWFRTFLTAQPPTCQHAILLVDPLQPLGKHQIHGVLLLLLFLNKTQLFQKLAEHQTCELHGHSPLAWRAWLCVK